MNDLKAQVLMVVGASPGVTSSGVCRALPARKTDVLAALDRACREGLLQAQIGKRGSRSWSVVAQPRNRFPSSPRPKTSPSPNTASGSEA
jgi:hypothetical protein